MRTADAYPFPTLLNLPVRFAIAVGSVAMVFLLDRRFDSVVDEGSLFLLLGVAVIASAWFAGAGPGLAATILSALLAANSEDTASAHARIALFVLQGLVLTGILSELRRARRIAERQAIDAENARREGESASRLKDEFLATISHELRTPLNTVLGWVHLLRTGKLDPGTSKRAWESIERNARLQAELTGNLLDISKALTGRLHVDCHPVSLTDVVRQTALAATPAADTRSVRIVQDVPDAPVALLGDWSRLRQIVWHLLTNALKFTPRGGTIRVAVRSEGEHACLVVADSGPGINPEFLPRIFDCFTQEDASPTRTRGGLGVGLSLIRELVELHGGEISAANNAEGTGAVFLVRFPLQPAASLRRQTPADASPSSRALEGSLDGLRVLVLERDGEGRDLVEAVLLQGGAAVRTTESVAEALEALESWRPDVLVSAHESTDNDAYAVIGKVPSLEADRGGRIPALALTSFARTDRQVRDLLADAIRDVPRPLEPAVLTAEIARLGGRTVARSRAVR